MKQEISDLLSMFFKKYKHLLDSEDLDKFGYLWKSFYEAVDDRDNIWKKGSKHYKNFKIQPGQYILRNNMKFPEGNVIKYTSRHDQETGGGKKDILKAIHYLEMILDRDYD
jgi:hypothetical protein|tara:strand:+ start:79 stop:411 length:333 start_codon:yes stop_codon:yes gene_type:complete